MAGPDRPDDAPNAQASRGGFEPGDPRNDRVYLGILIALMVTVFAAAAIAILGDRVWQSPALKQGGFYVAMVAGIAYFGFRTWGRHRAAQYRKARMRAELGRDPGEDGSDDRD
jgi:hypothetical protein